MDRLGARTPRSRAIPFFFFFFFFFGGAVAGMVASICSMRQRRRRSGQWFGSGAVGRRFEVIGRHHQRPYCQPASSLLCRDK